MSDIRRVVTINASTGTVTTLEDFEDNSTLYSIRDTFNVKPGERKQNMGQRTRRYGGALATFETHDNGAISWKALVRGTSANNVIANVEVALAVLEQPRNDMFFEWRPDGATNSVYYRIAGPATWAPTYSWVQFLGAQSMIVDITIPVRPLAQRAPSTITFSSTAFPATIALSSAIGGRAPALADLTLSMASGSLTPVWAMIAWTKRPGSSTLGAVGAPFGRFESLDSAGPSGWTETSDALAVANASGGSWLAVSTSGAGTSTAQWDTDPAIMQPDDFSDEVVLEVWARYFVAPTVVNPRLALAAYPVATSQSIAYSAEWGSDGKPLVKPSAGLGATRIARLGTVTVPVNTANPSIWEVGVVGRWDAGSSGTFALDYIAVVPARQRALSPSGKPLDASFPKFVPTTSAVTKTIRSDLSGVIDSPPARDSGLGGSPLELPPGNVNLFLMFSSSVPDDPTPSTAGVQLTHSASGSVKVTPRYFLASD